MSDQQISEEEQGPFPAGPFADWVLSAYAELSYHKANGNRGVLLTGHDYNGGTATFPVDLSDLSMLEAEVRGRAAQARDESEAAYLGKVAEQLDGFIHTANSDISNFGIQMGCG